MLLVDLLGSSLLLGMLGSRQLLAIRLLLRKGLHLHLHGDDFRLAGFLVDGSACDREVLEGGGLRQLNRRRIARRSMAELAGTRYLLCNLLDALGVLHDLLLGRKGRHRNGDDLFVDGFILRTCGQAEDGENGNEK